MTDVKKYREEINRELENLRLQKRVEVLEAKAEKAEKLIKAIKEKTENLDRLKK